LPTHCLLCGLSLLWGWVRSPEVLTRPRASAQGSQPFGIPPDILGAFQWRELMVGTKISGLTGGPSYCQPGVAGHASLSSTPLVPRGASASRREDTALAAHHTPWAWHSGEHSGLYKSIR